MIDLTTKYLGLTLKNPLVVSSSLLTEKIENILQMEQSGAAAIVFHSLFEEQIQIESHELDKQLFRGTESFAESLNYFPAMESYNLGPENYLKHLERAKSSVSIPIIGSLNGVSAGGWTKFAKRIEDAGADALELNLYYIPTELTETSDEIETMCCEVVSDVKQSVHIPVAVKLGHSFTALANFARRLDEAGVDGVVLFNRFYQPDFDLEKLEIVDRLILSHSHELLLRLHWTAILHGRIKPDIAITGGVHTAEDALKAMMAGARVAMMTSALLKNGISHLARVLDDLTLWMKDHEYQSVRQMQGSMSWRSVANPAAFECGNYMRVLSSYALQPLHDPR